MATSPGERTVPVPAKGVDMLVGDRIDEGVKVGVAIPGEEGGEVPQAVTNHKIPIHKRKKEAHFFEIKITSLRNLKKFRNRWQWRSC